MINSTKIGIDIEVLYKYYTSYILVFYSVQNVVANKHI